LGTIVKRAESVITGCALADKFGATWRDSTNPSIVFMVSVGGAVPCQIQTFTVFKTLQNIFKIKVHSRNSEVSRTNSIVSQK